MNFTQIIKEMNEIKEKTKHLPDAVKINPEWLELQLQQQFVLRKTGENPLGSLTGLRVIEDSTIKTYEFVYHEEA